MNRERRPLVDGLKTLAPNLDPKAERAFVFGKEALKEPRDRQPKSPITTRIRSDYAEALKRASLTRQLEGVTPNAVCDFLEEALEPWLKKHGYLS